MEITTDKSLPSPLALRATMLAIVMLGLCVRLLTYEHTTTDTFTYLLPWYQTAVTLGIDSLKLGLTNYAPFYSYLLLVAAQFDGVLPPLLLIKAISYVFELGSALIAYRLVSTATNSVWAPVFVFSATWLAPSVLFNGALWGQADALWSFFVLLAVYLACLRRFRSACVAFSIAVSVKAQAIFLGPFVFALVLQRKLSWLWLAAIPASYAALAAPVLLLGRPPADVFGIYLTQAETFRDLWSFVPKELYWPGLLIGLAASAIVGLAFSIRLARKMPGTPTALIFAAAASLQLMPFVLPKMHERYFYPFEVLSIVLVGVDPKLTVVAVASQIIAVLSYSTFEFLESPHLIYLVAAYLGLPLAAILNTFLLVFMQQRFWLDRQIVDFRMLRRALLLASMIYVAWFLIMMFTIPTQAMWKWWPLNRSDPVGLVGYLTVLAALLYMPKYARLRTASCGRPD